MLKERHVDLDTASKEDVEDLIEDIHFHTPILLSMLNYNIYLLKEFEYPLDHNQKASLILTREIVNTVIDKIGRENYAEYARDFYDQYKKKHGNLH